MFVAMNRFRIVKGRESDAFREAHKDAGQTKGMYLGGPQFEGFEVVLETKETAG